MTKKQILSIIAAMEHSNYIIATSDNITNENVKVRAEGYWMAFADVLRLFENPKYAKEIAEIYEVEL